MPDGDSSHAFLGPVAYVSRRGYIAQKLTEQLLVMILLFAAVWIATDTDDALIHLFGVDMLLLVLSYLHHGNNWDREHAVRPPEPPLEPELSA